jgi:epsin
MRSIKNVAKGYSPVQIQVRNGVFRFPCSNEDGHLLICTATSNDPWGPTVTEMYEIAQMTSDSTADFYEVMDMLDKRLNDKGKNWRPRLCLARGQRMCRYMGTQECIHHKESKRVSSLR